MKCESCGNHTGGQKYCKKCNRIKEYEQAPVEPRDPIRAMFEAIIAECRGEVS